MKKYILLGVTIIALGAGAYVSEKAFLASSHTLETMPETSVASSTTAVPTTSVAVSIKTTAKASLPTPNITLAVGSTTYTVYAPENSSVLDAMQTLAATNAFSFYGKEFPDMGLFVESINEKKNADGYYWILYVNGKSSDTGASQTTLKAGDIVEWRYEKGY